MDEQCAPSWNKHAQVSTAVTDTLGDLPTWLEGASESPNANVRVQHQGPGSASFLSSPEAVTLITAL